MTPPIPVWEIIAVILLIVYVILWMATVVCMIMASGLQRTLSVLFVNRFFKDLKVSRRSQWPFAFCIWLLCMLFLPVIAWHHVIILRKRRQQRGL